MAHTAKAEKNDKGLWKLSRKLQPTNEAKKSKFSAYANPPFP
jgi:hypothetical protein